MTTPNPVDIAIEYYDQRASSMDSAYAAEPKGWVLTMIEDLQRTLRGRRVLEVAWGTAVWTRYAAEAATHVTGVDAAPNMLAVARGKQLPADRVDLRLGDAFALADVPGTFDAGLAMQWFSHVPRARYAEFLDGWHARLGAGAVVFLGDNQPWDGMVDKPYAKAGHDDTYELRRLPGRPTYEIIKNYFQPDELRTIFAPYASHLTLHSGTYWWWLSYTVTRPNAAA